MTEAAQEGPQAPVVRIERGHPSPEEIAALTVVLLAAAGGETEKADTRRQGWSHRSRTFTPGAVRGAGWGAGF